MTTGSDLAPQIVLRAPVTNARFSEGGWPVTTEAHVYGAAWLIAATGGHNRPVIPHIERRDPSIVEYHLFALRNPDVLRGERVTVVGGGATEVARSPDCRTSRRLTSHRMTKPPSTEMD